MVAPTKLNFKIYQGSTFKETLRWESSEKGYAAITNISKAAPMVITAVGHTIPTGWRFKISNVGGMKEVNSTDTYYTASSTATDTVTVNDINSLGYTTYTSGGVLEYNVPNSLTGVTARMQIRSKLDSTTIIEELTTETGEIVFNDTLKTISISLPSARTTVLTLPSSVYSLEITSNAETFPFIYGTISLEKEITR